MPALEGKSPGPPPKSCHFSSPRRFSFSIRAMSRLWCAACSASLPLCVGPWPVCFGVGGTLFGFIVFPFIAYCPANPPAAQSSPPVIAETASARQQESARQETIVVKL